MAGVTRHEVGTLGVGGELRVRLPTTVGRAVCTSVLFSAMAVIPAAAEPFAERLADAAVERTHHTVRYDGSYRALAYPGGDVPADIGVCTDVVIRSYRTLGVDLQVLVHEDMTAHFDRYPSRRLWGLERPDANIDHRRVPNLQTFLSRHGLELPIGRDAGPFEQGDVVSFLLPGNLPHIGIVSNQRDAASGRPLIVHNVGRGPQLEDVLHTYRMTGHYRFLPVEVVAADDS